MSILFHFLVSINRLILVRIQTCRTAMLRRRLTNLDYASSFAVATSSTAAVAHNSDSFFGASARLMLPAAASTSIGAHDADHDSIVLSQ
jgi:hypothetical protein